MERQNNTKVLIAGLLVSSVIVAGGVYYLQTQAEEAALDIPTEPTSTIETTDLLYTNDKYGFSLPLSYDWEGFETQERVLDWGDLGTSNSVDFGFEENGEFYSLFNISIHEKNQWASLDASDGPRPTYAGENSEYVFGYSIAQDAYGNDYYGRLMDQITYLMYDMEILNK